MAPFGGGRPTVSPPGHIFFWGRGGPLRVLPRALRGILRISPNVLSTGLYNTYPLCSINFPIFVLTTFGISVDFLFLVLRWFSSQIFSPPRKKGGPDEGGGSVGSAPQRGAPFPLLGRPFSFWQVRVDNGGGGVLRTPPPPPGPYGSQHDFQCNYSNQIFLRNPSLSS
uniref:Uncharacterized protein n=1 Tax=Placozoa sp. H9 HM-2017 TaxID=2017597 RepID=A0A7I6N7U4_9METZ|nr:hypothetical protein [Placozoa sp. H9 HM-2017]